MPTLTLEQIRGHLHALVKAMPLQPGLKSTLPSAINGLPRDALEFVLRVVSQPATRWRLVQWLSLSLGAAQALAVVNQLPDQAMPTGLLIAQKARMVKKGRL